jgi:hypothetical protein
VAVEKLFFGKMLKKTLHYDAYKRRSQFSGHFLIPRFWGVSHETGLFQQPQDIATVVVSLKQPNVGSLYACAGVSTDILSNKTSS